MSDIFESHTASFSRVQFSQRGDGQWFRRRQDKGPWGYRWTAWTRCGAPESTFKSAYSGKARLPKG